MADASSNATCFECSHKALQVLATAALVLRIGASSVAAASEAAPSPIVAAAPRGVILIISDALRADHLGAYGYHRRTSPHIDALAEEGVLFERTYSQASWTTASIVSIFTGLYPSVHRTGHYKSKFGYVSNLPESIPTLAEQLRAHGFRTRAIANNPAISARLGVDRGFETYANDEVIPPTGAPPASDIGAIAALRELSDGPFLLVWHLIDPHWPYDPPDEFRTFVDPGHVGRFRDGFPTSEAAPLVSGRTRLGAAEREQVIALYDGDIQYMDSQVGRLLASVDELGLRSRVTVAFTSDHGEAFGEFGHYGHAHPQYEQTLHVPLIIRDARFGPARIEHTTQSIDLMPTLLELAGAPIPPRIQGRSLVPLLAGGAARDDWRERPAFSEGPHFVERKTIHAGGYQLIWAAAGAVLTDAFRPGSRDPRYSAAPQQKLYHLSGPEPRVDQAASRPGQASILRDQLFAQIRENELQQRPAGLGFRSVYFDEQWRDRVESATGKVELRNGELRLAKGAAVQWKWEFEHPVRQTEITVLTTCAPLEAVFAVSVDARQWLAADAHRDWGRARTAEFSMEDGPGFETLHLRFRADRQGGCDLAGFYAQLEQTEQVRPLDATTRDRLRALGYGD